MASKELLMGYANKAMAMLDGIHIPYSKNIVAWEINSRAKSFWGRCTRTFDVYKIEISETLLDRGSEYGIMETIIHEILHTCPDSMNHGYIWKGWGRIVKEKLGIEILVRADEITMGIVNTVLPIIGSAPAKKEKEYKLDLSNIPMTSTHRGHGNAKLAFSCSSCGKVIYRDRFSDIAKNPEKFNCTCGSHGFKAM